MQKRYGEAAQPEHLRHIALRLSRYAPRRSKQISRSGVDLESCMLAPNTASTTSAMMLRTPCISAYVPVTGRPACKHTALSSRVRQEYPSGFWRCIIPARVFPLIFRNSPISLHGVVYSAFYAFPDFISAQLFCQLHANPVCCRPKKLSGRSLFPDSQYSQNTASNGSGRKYGNPYIWIAVELAFGILYSLILRWKVRRVYPWLKTCTRNGAALKRQYPDILIRTKQVFIHKIKDFLLMQSDQIFVFAFDSFSMVAYYGNYTHHHPALRAVHHYHGQHHGRDREPDCRGKPAKNIVRILGN